MTKCHIISYKILEIDLALVKKFVSNVLVLEGLCI